MEQNVPILLSHLAQIVFYVVATSLLVTAALHDLAFRTVPNRLSAAVFAVGVLAAAFEGRLLYSLAGAASLFIVAALCWRRGLMGGGDVKLIAASAALLPSGGLVQFVLLVAICGGLLAVVYLLLQRIIRMRPVARPKGLLGRVLRAECWRIARRGSLPYASAIVAGALIVLGG